MSRWPKEEDLRVNRLERACSCSLFRSGYADVVD